MTGDALPWRTSRVRPYRDHDSERVYRTGVRAWEADDRLVWGACVEELRRRSAKALELAEALRASGLFVRGGH